MSTNAFADNKPQRQPHQGKLAPVLITSVVSRPPTAPIRLRLGSAERRGRPLGSKFLFAAPTTVTTPVREALPPRPQELASPGKALFLSRRVHSARNRCAVPPPMLDTIHRLVVSNDASPAPTCLELGIVPILTKDLDAMTPPPQRGSHRTAQQQRLHESFREWNRSAMTLLRGY